jgi:hypothetical protein
MCDAFSDATLSASLDKAGDSPSDLKPKPETGASEISSSPGRAAYPVSSIESDHSAGLRDQPWKNLVTLKKHVLVNEGNTWGDDIRLFKEADDKFLGG